MNLVNGQTSDTLSIHDRGLHYGDGVFETLAVEKGEALALEEHLVRLAAGATALGFPDADLSAVFDEIDQIIGEDERSVLKIILTRGPGGRGYRRPDIETEPSRILTRHPWPEDYNSGLYKNGIRVRLCETRLGHNPKLAGIKHLNRLEQVLARSEWDDADILEGLMLDIDGNVIEGCMSNIFLVSGRKLMTPALDQCGIHGVVRKLVLDAAAETGLDSHVTQVRLDDLTEADEVFICNSVLGLCHVRQFQKHAFNQSRYTEQIRNTLVQKRKIPSP